MLKHVLRASAAAGLLFTACLGFAQPAAPAAAKPQFEVASVKQNPTDIMKAAQLLAAGNFPKVGPALSGTRAEYNYMSVVELIQEAYQLKPYQIIAPDWMSAITAPRFDVVAKMPDGSTTKEEARAMLQTLLADRFKLVIRRENKEQSVLALVEAKGGHKMKPAVEEDPAATAAAMAAPAKTGEVVMSTGEGQARMSATKDGSMTMKVAGRGSFNISMDPATRDIKIEATSATMPEFAAMLSQYAKMGGGSNRQVVDMTKLTGKYQVALTLSYADIVAMARSMGVNVPAEQSAAGAPADAATDPSGNGFLQSVNALGLKLEQRKAPVDQLVVESVEKTPTEN